MDKPNRPNAFMFFLMLFIIIVPSFIGAGIVLIDMLGSAMQNPDVFISGDVDAMLGNSALANIPLWAMLVFTQVFMIGVPCVIYLIIHRNRIRDILPMRRLGGKNWLMVIFMTLAIFPVASLIGYVTSLIFGNPMADTMDGMMNETGGIIIMLILFPVLPSIFEEVAMRGIIFAGYTKVKIFTAAIINGLFFGILHQNFNQFSFAFVLGFVMCYMMYYTKSIWAPVLCHFVFNLVGVGLPYLIELFTNIDALEAGAQAANYDMAQWAQTFIEIGVMLLFAIASIGVFLLIYIAFKKHNLRRNELEGIVTDTHAAAIAASEPIPKAYTWGFWATIALGFAIMVGIQLLDWFLRWAGSIV